MIVNLQSLPCDVIIAVVASFVVEIVAIVISSIRPAQEYTPHKSLFSQAFQDQYRAQPQVMVTKTPLTIQANDSTAISHHSTLMGFVARFKCQIFLFLSHGRFMFVEASFPQVFFSFCFFAS